MRKFKICLLLLFILLSPLAYADEVNWDSIGNPDNAWDGQKPITNKEYDEVIKALEEKKQARTKKKKKFKGENLNKDSTENNDMLTNIESAIPLLNLTVKAVIGGEVLIPGHYKVVAEKKGKDVYLNFYQGHSMVARTLAYETEDDFDSNEIYFLKTKFVENNQLLLMFGYMEFNAFVYVNYLDN